jgi:hypothetical protein
MRVAVESRKPSCAEAQKQGIVAVAEQRGPNSWPLFLGCGKRSVRA